MENALVTNNTLFNSAEFFNSTLAPLVFVVRPNLHTNRLPHLESVFEHEVLRFGVDVRSLVLLPDPRPTHFDGATVLTDEVKAGRARYLAIG